MKKLNCVKLNQEKAPIPTICSIKALIKFSKRLVKKQPKSLLLPKITSKN
ncbi:phosphoribosyl-ATP pyrophosphatase [Listeria monocytogenes]|nr:phosphoribosyl-ATP pyrophosphatase [Listeria monocytogenes]GAT38109.1 phosphoribosyl-ATP pyrophosphatase [Listeria monocytogenes]